MANQKPERAIEQPSKLRRGNRLHQTEREKPLLLLFGGSILSREMNTPERAKR